MMRHEMSDILTRHEISVIVMRHEMSDMWWVTWDQDMKWVTWDWNMRWVIWEEWSNDETWDEWHGISDMWLTDADPILSVISLFWTLWQTLCLTRFLTLEARLSDVMMRHEMSDMRSRLSWVRDTLKPYSSPSGQQDAAGWASVTVERVGRDYR